MTLLPYPISGLYYRFYFAIPCNQSSSLFCSIFYNVINISVDILFVFLLLFIVFTLTQNLKRVSFKKSLFLSIIIVIISLISRNLAGFLVYNSDKDPNLVLLKLGFPTISINILNIFTGVFLSPVIISISVYFIMRRLALQKAITISLIVFLVITQWIYIPIIWESSERDIQRVLVTADNGDKSEAKFFVGIKHEVVSEEIINDSNNPKYKSLRINVKLIVPETKLYALYGELRDKTGNGSVAVQSYVNGKSLITSAIIIDLNKGENLVTFDFPYVYFNEYVKKEVVNLPYNDTVTGSYGPYRLSFRLGPTNFQELMDKASLSGSDIKKLEYESVYITKNIYKYLDFYQR